MQYQAQGRWVLMRWSFGIFREVTAAQWSVLSHLLLPFLNTSAFPCVACEKTSGGNTIFMRMCRSLGVALCTKLNSLQSWEQLDSLPVGRCAFGHLPLRVQQDNVPQHVTQCFWIWSFWLNSNIFASLSQLFPFFFPTSSYLLLPRRISS